MTELPLNTATHRQAARRGDKDRIFELEHPRAGWTKWNVAAVTFALLLLFEFSSAHASWPHRRVAGPFVIHADFELSGCEPLLVELASLQRDVSRQLGVAPTREVIQLYWFSDKTVYERYLQRHFPRVPLRRALFIKGAGPGMMLCHVSSEFAVDVRHECTHAVLHAALPMVPLWLDEGLAEYFEVPSVQRLKGNPHHAAVRRAVALGAVPGLADLERRNELTEMTPGDYRAAWAWTHFMLHGPPAAQAELRGYLLDIAQGRPPGQLSQRLASRVPHLETQFRRHFSRR